MTSPACILGVFGSLNLFQIGDCSALSSQSKYIGEQKANMLNCPFGTSRHPRREVRFSATRRNMDEGRKRVLLIAASILAARKLAQYDGGKRVPATVAAISDAVRWAEEIMGEIDERWP